MRGYVKKLSRKLSKLSREQLESLVEDLMDENENVYSIMESLSTGLIILNNDFCVLQSNHIAESQISFITHLDDAKNQNIPFWNIVEDEEIGTYIKKCADKGITNSCEEFSTMTSGGTIRFLSLTVNPLVTNSNLTGRIIIIRDITESKKQEVLVHRMENMANLTNLAAGMAHEIKNPLGAISIHMQLIQKALEKARGNNDILPPKKFVEDHVDVVNEEVQHLNKLVMDFLFAVRPVNATLQLKNPAALIKNFVDFFEPEFNKFNTEVEFIVDENQPKIMLDEKLFRDVILNLAQNSLAAIKAQFPECSIEKEDTSNYVGKFQLKCCVKDNRYLIHIKDNGCGMTNETIAKLFEPYYTTKANGTGLGMTMVYKIIKEFSGEIQVESAEGLGTEFILSFPIPQDNKKLLSESK